MDESQKAALLRIIGQAAIDLADVLDGAGLQAAPAGAPTMPELPLYETKRVKYLLAFVEAGGTLSLAQVRMAAKKAGMGNPGAVTSRGYVEKTGHDSRTISAKGKAWLEKRTGMAA